MGLLDQEVAKLAVYVGDAPAVTRDDVDKLVGRSRAAETFRIFDAIGAGRPADALAILARLFEQGEDPLQLLGAFSWQLRRLAQVSRHARLGKSLTSALEEAGVPPFARTGVEQQLRHLGRRRLDRLYDWLLEADLAMKSSGALPPRVLLERLVVRLARPRAG
jgi:DNA polymerase-3 subunit delta